MTDATPDRWHLEKVVTPRGFAFLPDIPSEYGGAIAVSESSAADGPHVWVRVAVPVDINNPYGDTREAAMHLTADNAQRLGEQLLLVTREHYQGNPLRMALELIGTDCANFTGDATCADGDSNRSPYAKYTADRWCDQCVARVALAGGELPDRGANPDIEEVP